MKNEGQENPAWEKPLLLGLFGLAIILRAVGLNNSLNFHEVDQLAVLCDAEEFKGIFTGPGQLRPIAFQLASAAMAKISCAEWSVRLLPFVGSVLGFFPLVFIARTLFAGPALRLLAVVLWTTDPLLVVHASILKPYGIEANLALLLVALLLHTSRAKNQRSLYALLLVAPLSVGWGHPMVFVLPFVATALLLRLVPARDWRAVLLTAASMTTALAVFALQLFWVVKKIPRSNFPYWDNRFHAPTIKWHSLFSQAIEIFGDGPWPTMSNSFWLHVAVAAICLWGVFIISQQGDNAVLLVLVGPLLLPFVASVADKWPYGLCRTNTFMVPLSILLFVKGLQGLKRTGLHQGHLAPAVLVTITVAILLANRTEYINSRVHHMDFKGALIQMVVHHRSAGPHSSEPAIFVNDQTLKLLDFYRKTRPLPIAQEKHPWLMQEVAVLPTENVEDISARLLQNLQPIRQGWVLYISWDKDLKTAVEALASKGRVKILQRVQTNNAGALLISATCAPGEQCN